MIKIIKFVKQLIKNLIIKLISNFTRLIFLNYSFKAS